MVGATRGLRFLGVCRGSQMRVIDGGLGVVVCDFGGHGGVFLLAGV